MTALRWTIRIHKWLALIVGLQIILWIIGGFGMSLMKIEEVRGEHLSVPAERLDIDAAALVSPQQAVAASGVAEVHGVEITHWMGRVVYRIEPMAGGIVMVDATSGEMLSPIDEATARAVALADHIGDPEITSIELLLDPPQEASRPGPLWRVELDDGEGTRLYIAPATGEVLSRRNDRWRLFDFLWMLHIMDYEEREDFNHPLLQIASGIALATVLAGFFLLILRLRRLWHGMTGKPPAAN